ncbi:MAG: hypothetical protein GX938_08975 [Spirochaetales bacterium]|nr:hypothetical protein [Spirochaetales bacterium]
MPKNKSFVDVARSQLEQAQQNFRYAERDYIDIAIYELNAAEQRLALALEAAQQLAENEKVAKVS